MKKTAISLVFLALIFSASKCTKPSDNVNEEALPSYINPEEPLRIGAYNVLVNSENYGTFSWSQRKDYLVQSLIDLNLDICALEEFATTIRSYVPAPVSAGTPRKYIWWRLGDMVAEVNNLGIVYDGNRLSLSRSCYFWLSETPDVPSHGWGEVKHYRTVMMATFTDKATGKKFIFAATHLALDDEARDHSGEIILSKLNEYNTENLPVILGGDMNGLCHHQYALDLTKEYFKDVFLMLGDDAKSGPVSTFNSKNNNADLSGPNLRIDQLYVHGDMQVFSYCADTTQYNGQYPSDHLPIYITAKF